MKRLTSLTAGDATRSPHYIHGPGVKKDDLLQRLGKLEDAICKITDVLFSRDITVPRTIDQIKDVIVHLEEECHENDS